MWNQPTEAQLATIPKLYETEHISTEDKIIHCHFFIGDCHWLITEFDGVDTMFGFCILNADFLNSEWGYASLEELKQINIKGIFQVQFDITWVPKPAGDVELIRRGGGILSDPRDEANGGQWETESLGNQP